MVWPFTRKPQPVEAKAHPNGGAFMVPMGAGWARKDAKQDYISEGYQLNVIVYRAVQDIANAACEIDLELYNGGEEAIERHPLLDLLKRPTPTLTWQGWLRETIVNRMLMGEWACVGSGEARPAEIWPVNPLHVKVVPGASGVPAEYIHQVNNRKVRFPVDQITGQSDLLFVKTYNPADYWRGQSPLMAAALAGDTHNSGMRWNYSLLRNSARPSGLVRFKGTYPSGEIIQRMREYFKARITGADNAGEIPMLAEDAEWQSLSQTARDMDFLKTMQETAKYVASALGVPLPLIDNDASTFNNLEQAKERLYTDTVLPIMREIVANLNNWLAPRFGEGLELRIDMDAIPALEANRERTFGRAVTAYEKGVLTREEARILIGYEPEGEGEFKPMPGGLPDLGAEDAKALAYGLGDFEIKADSLKPTETMRNNYRRGLKKHEEGLSGDGIEEGTIRVARDIANGESVTADWVRKANRWWARNARFLGEDEDSPAYVSALLWGGAAGRDWYRARAKELDAE